MCRKEYPNKKNNQSKKSLISFSKYAVVEINLTFFGVLEFEHCYSNKLPNLNPIVTLLYGSHSFLFLIFLSILYNVQCIGVQCKTVSVLNFGLDFKHISETGNKVFR